MAAKFAAARLGTFRQSAIRQPFCSKIIFLGTPRQTSLVLSRNYWSGLERSGGYNEAAPNQNKVALDILSADSGPSNVVGNADPDLEIELPSNFFADRSNQPSLINIPPQQDPLLAFLASRLMNHGHRAKASRIVSRTLLNIHAYTRASPLPILREAIFTLAPAVRLLRHRHSTKTIYKPVALSEKQGIWYAVEWLLEECKGRQGGPMIEERLAREIIKVIKGQSKALTKKMEMHKLATVNRGNVESTKYT